MRRRGAPPATIGLRPDDEASRRGGGFSSRGGTRADAFRMSASLRRSIDSGDYLVDPDAVADAMLRRVRERARALARPPSEVLVTPQLLETFPPEPAQLGAMSPDDPP